MPGDMVLELTQATNVKNAVRIVDGLTLAIRAGERPAIVGPKRKPQPENVPVVAVWRGLRATAVNA